MAEHPHAALVRKGYEAFNRGDMETLAEMLAGDATQHVPGNSPLSGDYKGRDEMLAYYRRLAEESDGTMTATLLNVLVDGRGHAVSVHRVMAKRMGRTLDAMGGIVFRIIGDKATDLDECMEDIEVSDEFWS
ncbi:nuclear transport factor 2 family protein [Streptomyces sp. NPDC002205]|uniref:nuclear transport factor 2 family protein n=1 Tax=Streptomyces sp. NPDC002205 TaxID=3154411 RepID=UPI00332C1FDC